jgi:uncharacterized protein
MAIPQRLSIVTLGVANLERSTAFYRALGWEPNAASTDGIVWFATAGSVVGLFPRGELAEDVGVADVPLIGFRGVTLAMNFENETLVDAAMADALSAGAELIKRPTKTPWGGYSGYFADPDGHYWELVFAPGFTVLPNGRLEL